MVPEGGRVILRGGREGGMIRVLLPEGGRYTDTPCSHMAIRNKPTNEPNNEPTMKNPNLSLEPSEEQQPILGNHLTPRLSTEEEETEVNGQ